MASESKPRRAAAAGARAAKAPAPRRRGSWRDALSLDSERSARFLLIGSVVLVLAVAAGFIAFGYWTSVIKPRNRTVLAADGIRISYSAMKRRMAYEYFQNIAYQQDPRVLPEGTYQTLLDEITVIGHANDLGITVPDDEFDTTLRTRVGVGPDADQKAFADALSRQLTVTGLHEDEYRRMIKAQTLSQKIKDHLKTELPAATTQAKVEVIATNTEDDANKAAARIAAGEDWAAVAKDMSTEVDVQTTGGAHDYAPQGSFNPAYDGYVFSADIGKVSPPLAGASQQFFIVRVDDRADKPVTDDQKPALVAQKYRDWLSNTQSQMSVTRAWDTQSQSDALVSVLTNAGKRQQQAPPQNPAQPPAQPPADQQTPAQQQPPASGDQGGQNQPAVPNAPAAPGGNGQ